MASLNAPPQYYAAEARYREARSRDEKLAALQEMLRLCPKHKSAQNILAEIRGKITRLKQEEALELKQAAQRRAARAGRDFVRREGAAQVVLVGFANSGKSFLLNALTNARVASTEQPFETQAVTPGIMFFEKVQIQLLDTPSVTEQNKARVYAIARNADMVLVLANNDEEKRALSAFADIGAKRVLFASSREPVNALRKKIFDSLALIRVFTKNPRDPRARPDFEHPVALPRGATVADLAKQIHKDFGRGLRYARVWGSTRFAGQQVSADYALADGDVVELHLR